MKGCPITVDHEKSVRSLIGQVNRVFRDGDYLRFDGTIDDEGIIRQVKKGRVRGVSVGLEGIGACSKCGKVGFKKTCDCKGAFTWVKQIKGKEISLVTRPAYGDSSQIEEFEEVEEE
jgi:phage head maturation protease